MPNSHSGMTSQEKLEKKKIKIRYLKSQANALHNTVNELEEELTISTSELQKQMHENDNKLKKNNDAISKCLQFTSNAFSLNQNIIFLSILTILCFH